jgi:hypothetical protein
MVKEQNIEMIEKKCNEGSRVKRQKISELIEKGVPMKEAPIFMTSTKKGIGLQKECA